MNLSIRAQLIGGFSIIVALVVAVLAVSYWGMNSMGNARHEITDVDVPAEKAVGQIEVLVLEQTVYYLDYMVARDPESLEKIDHSKSEIEGQIVALHDLFGNDPAIDGDITSFHESYNAFVDEGDLFLEEINHTAEGEITHAELEILHVLESQERAMLDELRVLAGKADARIEHAAEVAAGAQSRAITFAIGLSVIAAAVSSLIAVVVTRKITSGLSAVETVANDLSNETLPYLVRNMERAAAGDLTAVFNTNL